MSNSNVIAAVTDVLFHRLQSAIQQDQALGGVKVRMEPPDKAATVAHEAGLLNLFLYHTAICPYLRNMDIPWKVKPGETGHPPLSLSLHYLLTVYSASGDDRAGHKILGRAMAVLHDQPVLTAREINLALSDIDGQAQSYEEAEHVRITPVTLSLDEMSKLWSTFQTEYRLSATYKVAVVLIESEKPPRTPLPVLSRGENDRGVYGQASMDQPLPAFPKLTAVEPASGELSAMLGEAILIKGYNLDVPDPQFVFRHALLDKPIIYGEPDEQTIDTLKFTLPDENAPVPWDGPPGVYRVGLAYDTTVEDEEPEEPEPVQCPGFLPSRLVVGARGRVRPDGVNSLRDSPSATGALLGDLVPGDVFAVLEGPVCDETEPIAWWRVKTGMGIGWTGEGQTNTYWVDPLDPPASCPGFAAPRLVTGQRGRVTSTDRLNVRDLPSVAQGIVLDSLAQGTEFAVLGGPVCDAESRLAWWRIQANGAEGWMAEGQNNIYWTEPVAPAIPEPPSFHATTNERFFALAPRIMDIDHQLTGTTLQVTVRFIPGVLPQQQVLLLFGDRSVPATERTGTESVNELTFTLKNVQPDNYLVRLRVDGIESLFINRSQSPPTFDETLRVKIG